MTRRPDVIIGVDPDVDGSGVVVLLPKEKEYTMHNLSLPEFVESVKSIANGAMSEGRSVLVVVEASYLISANWHLDHNDSQRRAAAKGKQVGRNHEIGRQIVEFCKYLNIPYEEKLPLTKCWAGKDGKITHEELQMLLDGMGFPPIKGTTNPEKRDAMLIALDRSALPLIMAPKKKKQR